MEQGDINTADLHMDPADLYREDVYTDRKLGTIRVLTPVTADGDTDTARATSYIGQTQILTPVGSLPITFEIEAATLADALAGYADAAKAAIDQAIDELKEMRRQAASSIVVPEAGGMGGMPGGMGGMPGGGKIQMP